MDICVANLIILLANFNWYHRFQTWYTIKTYNKKKLNKRWRQVIWWTWSYALRIFYRPKTIYIDGGKEEQYSTTQLFSSREVTSELYLLYLIAFNRVIGFLAIILSKGCGFKFYVIVSYGIFILKLIYMGL